MFTNSWLNAIIRLYERLIKWASSLQSLFLLWMRLTWGPQFFIMGSEKLKNINEASEFFTSLGFSHPIFHSYLTGYIELIGGLLLIIGFASRLAAIPLMFATLTILTAAHTPAISEWKFFTHPSLIAHQSPYPFLITTLLILIFGPGLFSIDGWVKRWLHKRNHHYPS